jgi:hypothetical protein
MKRILCVFVLAVLAAAPGFTQELTFSGYGNYGVGVEFSSKDGEDDVLLRTAGVDSEQKGGRFQLNGAYANAGKTAGADLRFQLQGNSAATYDVGLAYAYGWVSPIDMLTIKAGLVADATFQTQGAILKDDAGLGSAAGAGAGIFVKLSPVPGLDLGAGAYPRSADGGNANNKVERFELPKASYDVKYVFGLAYTMTGLFKINTSFRSFNHAGVAASYPARFVGEVQVLAVKDLTAIFEVELNNLYTDVLKWDEFGKTGQFNIFETLAYKTGDLRIGINAAQYIENTDGKDDMGLRFNPWVSYSLAEDTIVPRLDAVYFMAGDRHPGDRFTGGGNTNKYDRRSDLGATYNSDTYVFNVRPSVKINLDSRNSLEIGNVFYYRKLPNIDGFFDNVFYVDLVVRF